MKFYRVLLISCFCSPVLWASFQPITGSSVTVYSPNNNTTPLPVSGTIGIINAATIAVTPTDGQNTQLYNEAGAAFVDASQYPLTITHGGVSQPVFITNPSTATLNSVTQTVQVTTAPVSDVNGLMVSLVTTMPRDAIKTVSGNFAQPTQDDTLRRVDEEMLLRQYSQWVSAVDPNNPIEIR